MFLHFAVWSERVSGISWMEAMIRGELLQEVDALARLPATLAAALVHSVETWSRRRFLLTGARRHCVVGKGPQKLPRDGGTDNQ